MTGNTYWLKRKTRNPYYNHKVLSVEYCGREDVYDVRCVEGFHNFAANGVFVHNCFSYDIDDSLNSIFDVLKTTAKTFQMGGGVGISISNLREKGASIKTTNGVSSGPVDFLHLYDSMVERVKAGGFRRGYRRDYQGHSGWNCRQSGQCIYGGRVHTKCSAWLSQRQAIIGAVICPAS